LTHHHHDLCSRACLFRVATWLSIIRILQVAAASSGGERMLRRDVAAAIADERAVAKVATFVHCAHAGAQQGISVGAGSTVMPHDAFHGDVRAFGMLMHDLLNAQQLDLRCASRCRHAVCTSAESSRASVAPVGALRKQHV
jgi:hypothetical protein